MDFIVLRSENWSFDDSSAENSPEKWRDRGIKFEWQIQPPTHNYHLDNFLCA